MNLALRYCRTLCEHKSSASFLLFYFFLSLSLLWEHDTGLSFLFLIGSGLAGCFLSRVSNLFSPWALTISPVHIPLTFFSYNAYQLPCTIFSYINDSPRQYFSTSNHASLVTPPQRLSLSLSRSRSLTRHLPRPFNLSTSLYLLYHLSLTSNGKRAKYHSRRKRASKIFLGRKGVGSFFF